MKPFILLSFLLVLLSTTQAQTTAPGYYITQANDTVTTQIGIRKGAFGQATNEFLKEVEVLDSVAGAKKFTPDDIRGYGVTYNGKPYVFLSKPTKDGSKKFLAPVFTGPKTSLYKYGTVNSGGAMSNQQTFYTFEHADGSNLFLRDILNKHFRSEVKEFYKNYPGLPEFIDTKLKYWLDLDKDLKEILQKANEQ